MKLLVTGANGFLGQALLHELALYEHDVLAVTRYPMSNIHPSRQISWQELLDMPETYLSKADAVIHLAGRAHIGRIKPKVLEEENRITWQSNVELTLKLAELTFRYSQARFVFISSIGVHGRTMPSITPISASSPCQPENIYAQTKLEAEYRLQMLAAAWGGDYTVVRPPLVYGHGAPANFGALARVAATRLPLPLRAANAPRAMIGVRNLSSFLTVVATHPKASRETFVISDQPSPSTRQMVELLRHKRGQPFGITYLPPAVMQIILSLIGQGEIYKQLFQPLLVDAEYSRTVEARLNWTPPYTLEDNLNAIPHIMPSKVEESLLAEAQVIKQLNVRQRHYGRARQRAEQLLVGTLLLFSLPALLLIALFIKLDSPGPALFMQERAGRGHHPFKIYKFRTMHTDTPHLSTEEMQRSGLNPVTRIGAILRRTSLDELPQLLNVLKGEMSLVGPRPALMTQTRVLTLRERAGVDQLLPGITGYAQATGRDDLSDEEKVRRDRFYLENLGLSMDLRVIWLTVRSVFKGTGNK